jgi:putative hydrolase of the HAD superfamily
MIEALLFDLGKVLIDFDFEIGIRSMVESSSISRDKFEAVLWDKRWIRDYECGKVSTEEFHQYLRDSGGLNMDLSRFCETWSSIFLPEPIVSESLLLALSEKYPLVLISNTNQSHADFIGRRYTVFRHFNHLIFSHEVGSVKPAREIYETAIAASGAAPGNLFFTDDREENVRGAQALGIHAHQFVSEGELVQALLEKGVDLSGYRR